MFAYIFRRLLLIIPTLLGIITINFIIVQGAPGGPVEQMIAEIKRSVGVDRSGAFSIAADGMSLPVTTETGDRVARPDSIATPKRTDVRPVSVTMDGQDFEFEVEVRHET